MFIKDMPTTTHKPLTAATIHPPLDTRHLTPATWHTSLNIFHLTCVTECLLFDICHLTSASLHLYGSLQTLINMLMSRDAETQEHAVDAIKELITIPSIQASMNRRKHRCLSTLNYIIFIQYYTSPTLNHILHQTLY